jgi:hypothetical protein
MAVLHTWTQRLDYHPHVHCLVSGGGVSAGCHDRHEPAHSLLAARTERRHDLMITQARGEGAEWDLEIGRIDTPEAR